MTLLFSLEQWSLYDESVAGWSCKLRKMCHSETEVTVVVSVSESSQAPRCASNVVKVEIKHDEKPIPAGSYITITGLNGAL